MNFQKTGRESTWNDLIKVKTKALAYAESLIWLVGKYVKNSIAKTT